VGEIGARPRNGRFGRAIFSRRAQSRAPQGVSARGAVLHLLYPERDWRDAPLAGRYPPLLVGALALVPVALLAGAIAGRLSRPIVELRWQVGRIAHGDFQPLPLPPHNDELRDVDPIGNALAGQLDEMQRLSNARNA